MEEATIKCVYCRKPNTLKAHGICDECFEVLKSDESDEKSINRFVEREQRLKEQGLAELYHTACKLDSIFDDVLMADIPDDSLHPKRVECVIEALYLVPRQYWIADSHKTEEDVDAYIQKALLFWYGLLSHKEAKNTKKQFAEDYRKGETFSPEYEVQTIIYGLLEDESWHDWCWGQYMEMTIYALGQNKLVDAEVLLTILHKHFPQEMEMVRSPNI